MSEVTRILNAVEQGDRQAASELLPLVYDELRKLAANHLNNEKPGQTLQPTALVHEAYLRLVGPANAEGFGSLRHFFGAAAEAMRRILVENARRRTRFKHGGLIQREYFDALDVPAPEAAEEMVALSEALDHLAATHPAAAELIKLRFFAGLSNEKAAEVLGVSARKANQIWAYGRAWLAESLGHEPARLAPE